MVNLIRESVAKQTRTTAAFDGLLADARAIVALLPEPVDPDLLIAREVAANTLVALGASSEMIAAADIREGTGDDKIIMHAVLFAIKRGRELAAQS